MPTDPIFPARILASLKAPDSAEGATLEEYDGALVCPQTGLSYPFREGVPSLFFPTGNVDTTSVTTRIKSFYEENPFPTYEGIEDFGELVHKGLRNSFSTQLLDAIGQNKSVLECGCGTGQLSHFLQLNNNYVLGVDMSRHSLQLALEHKRRNNLKRSAFVQMNIFNLAIEDASFDVVISSGVLHHTYDARLAFRQICRKVKPGGIVIVGLYNSYARIPTWLRSKVVGWLGPRIDYVVRNRIHDARKAEIWIKDQYHNPHETWHSVDEVLKWFDENQIDYLNCSPAILGTSGEDEKNLFAKTDPGTAYQRVVTQLAWLGTIAREGALFEMIGRRRA
jgi:2-polyprenyl-3-methyl-5-hydroxy-6-metoxy-1,4-benzoquinol methylase